MAAMRELSPIRETTRCRAFSALGASTRKVCCGWSPLPLTRTRKRVGFGSGFPDNFSEHTYEHVSFPAMPSGTQACDQAN